ALRLLFFPVDVSIFIFFFQAEDGIRAGHVTGVQTCALPISRSVRARAVGYRQTAFYELQESTYLAVFEPAAGPASPTAIRPCSEIGRASCRERVWDCEFSAYCDKTDYVY